MTSQTSEGSLDTTALLTRAGALLIDAACMLRMEAQEWDDRRGTPPRGQDKLEWKKRCESIAGTDRRAADAMSAHAKKIAAEMEPA